MNSIRTILTSAAVTLFTISSAQACFSEQDGENSFFEQVVDGLQIIGNGYNSGHSHPQFPDFKLSFVSGSEAAQLGFDDPVDWNSSKKNQKTGDRVWIEEMADSFGFDSDENFDIDEHYNYGGFGGYWSRWSRDNSSRERFTNYGLNFSGSSYGSVTEVPEPSTIVLLCLGSLFFIKKYRA